MTTFDVGKIKEAFMDSIRTYVYPYQGNYSNSISLYDNARVINQEVYLFSSSISSYGVYVAGTIGSPGGLTLTLMNRGTVVGSSSITGTIGWNIVSLIANDLSTSRPSTLIVAGDVDVSNDYLIGGDSIGAYYFNDSSTLNIAFTIGVKDFVYKVFPQVEFDNNNFPMIVIDVSGRPRVDNRYLSGDYSWFDITVRAEIYSKYTKELDKLCYGIDRGIYYNRKDFLDTYFITPADLSEITYVKPEVYNRNLSWVLKQLIARE